MLQRLHDSRHSKDTGDTGEQRDAERSGQLAECVSRWLQFSSPKSGSAVILEAFSIAPVSHQN